MTAFTVEPEDGESELLGKLVSDLQDEVVVKRDEIEGTLKYVTGYTGFSGNPDLQEGNFLALKVGNVPEGASMYVEVVGGHSGPVQLDSDLNCVLRLEDKWHQTIRFICTLDGVSSDREFSLGDMVFETED